MQEIIAPLQAGDRGLSVANLQDILQLFLDRGILLANEEGARRELSDGLQRERAEQIYRAATLKLVTIFQETQPLEPRLEPSGNVDERTATAINAILRERGWLDQHQAETLFVVSGQIQQDSEQPFEGGLVRAFHESEQGEIRLGEDTTDPEGRYTIRYASLPGISSINLKVIVSAADLTQLQSSETIQAAQPIEIVNLVVSSVTTVNFQVEGIVSSPVSAGVSGLQVRIVDKTVGEDITLTETTTHEDGTYQATFTDTNLRQRGKVQPDLQARIFSGDRFLAASEVHYNATARETLNVLLNENITPALQSEYEILTRNLSSHFQGSLRDLQETDTRPDVTYLANKTGWDARAVALAALADQFSARTQDANGAAQIEPALFYTLFRAGLPANGDALYQVDAQTAAAVWEQGIKQGVIPAALESHMPQALEHFQGLSAQRALDAPAVVGVSSLKDMLTTSLGDNPEQQQQFANLHTQHKGDLPQFWEAVRGSFGEATEKRLKLDGQLGYLTINNAPLIANLHAASGQDSMTDPLNLVEQGYYKPEQWRNLISDGVTIPSEIPGETDPAKQDNYAELMSAQVRLSYPTAVVAQMVKNGETPLKNNLGDQVHALLMEQQGNFEIGMQPIEQYVLKNNLQVAPEVIQEVTRIQRVHQITPGDKAMNTLLRNNLDSAYKVVQYDKTGFVQTFKDELGGEAIALLTYAKAQQVHNTVLNITTSYLTGRNAPSIGSNPDGLIINALPSPPAAANAADIIAYPTLETLFGEMDYCTCEHCQSILSPAAYLVNLLQFCDPPTNEKENPQTVLLERRPDIQHLLLTCENTNTPLPYIDVVNETLEYFVTHNLKLENYKGHNIDSNATSEELLASPQFVSDKAYETLSGKPAQVGDPLPLLPPTPPLPFHQSLENLRRYFNQFESPLPQVMEALRKNDGLERANETEYGWRDILMEALQISRAEYRLLTDRTLTLHQLYGYVPAIRVASVLPAIANAKTFTRRVGISYANMLAAIANTKTFTRRVGISYEEIIDILKTRFINPNSILIPKLEQLRVPFASLKALKDGAITDADFDALLPSELDTAPYGGDDIKAWVRNDANFANIMSLIALTNPIASSDVCRFDQLEFRYVNPDNATNRLRPFEFVRLIRFIRLWKKLGWTIEQTDKAITALYPIDQTPNDPDDAVNLQRLDAGFLILLPRLGVIKQVMDSLNLKPKKDLLPLLACFAPIDTHGISLYRQRFLSPALLKQDTVFAEDGFGNFLIDNAQMLMAHTEALRAALLLTDDELHQITASLGYNDNTPLTLDTLSAVFRRGWLARTLKLSVREFLLLIQFTGLNPFAAPDPFRPPIQGFIELVHHLRALSVKPVQALYLIWNQDISGQSVPSESEILDFARSLRAALSAIESEYTLIDDPDGQITHARMALVYGNAATDLFFGLLESTLVSYVPYSHGQVALEGAITNTAPERITYDDFRKQLSFTGVLTSAMRDALKAIAAVSPQFQTAVDNLYVENQKVIQPFFFRYPELLPIYEIYIASNDPVEKKRSDLLVNFLPELKRRRKRQQVLQSISAATKVEEEFASALLDNATVLHATDTPTHLALNDLIALENVGLSAQFFFRDTATGSGDLTRNTEADLFYSTTGRNLLPANPAPDSAISGIWKGYLEAPESGFYNLSIEADAGSTVALMLDGKAIALTQTDNLWRNAQPIDLRAGTLYAIALTVEKVKNTLVVRWRTAGRGWEVIPSPYLYPDVSIDHLRVTYIRFLKVTALAIALKLTPSETAYLATHPDTQIDGQGWLNSLPVTGSPDSAKSIALRSAFAELLNFAYLKSELSPDDERLLTLLKDPVAATETTDRLLFRLTQWESTSLNALLAHFGMAIADLSHLQTFRRIFDAYATVKALGIPASALLRSVTNEPNAVIVRDLQSALRARYNESDWLKVLKPINDEMRGLQRDALVAYILHQMRQNNKTQHIDTPDKLFEYFLMDVQMDPCMQTSRIRHALSSVQLFIERCLMNLESTRVSPLSINAKQWAWMKRYRVWEANRKIFLYPENWLEPELRDDQSPFFKEAMSELLQGDITEDRAAEALLNYLSKLEEVAKLEPCGIHYVENDPGKLQDDVAHVVARTAGASRKYFYRRREASSWTPWEQIKLAIDDKPVAPVVWKDRLFLFWLQITQMPSTEANPLPQESDRNLTSLTTKEINISTPRVMVKAALCWSEYYNGKWQPTKTSNVLTPNELGEFDTIGPKPFNRSQLRLSFSEENDALNILISPGGNSPLFILYNTHSLPVPGGLQRELVKRNRSLSKNEPSDPFTITYFEPNLVEYKLERSVLKNPMNVSTISPRHFLGDPWNAPFFYEDSRHVFYISTSNRSVTISKIRDYLTVTESPQQVYKIPHIESKPMPFPPHKQGDPVIIGQKLNVVNPAPTERRISEDAYINKGIGTIGSVRYGDKELGPTGVLFNQKNQQR